MLKKSLLLSPILVMASAFQLPSHTSQAAKSFKVSQGASLDKTVDQTRKNIQILKGLPDSQLFLLMNFVASSLGEQCSFCHVQQGKDAATGRTKWVWESDDKPEKQTARRMMQMVLAIKANNKVDFRENEVTCYTCHRGQRKPVGIPAMPLAKSAHEGEPAATGAHTNLPSVDQILTKYLEAVGGSAATTTRTLVLKGTREATQNRHWPNEIFLTAPDKFSLVATPPEGKVQQIVNGDEGWVVNGANIRKLAPADVLSIRRSWDELFNVIKVKQSSSMKVRRAEKIGEREASVVEETTEGKIQLYYFDSQTGLLLRKMTINRTMLMPFPDQVDFEDYREVDGVKVPFTIRYSGIDTYDSWTRKFTEIKRNVVVDAKLFSPPPK